MKSSLHFCSCTFFTTLLFSLHLAAQPTISFNQLAGGLNQPLEIKNAGDGSGRLFIAEQGGRIKIYKNGSLLNKPFLDLHTLVGTGQFLGIWSIAFSPNYPNNREFFVLYTDKSKTTALARYKVSKNDPNVADPNSSVILLSFPNAGDGHYGNIDFGKDGYLYITLGAGGNNKLSQNGQSYFGKMLRLDVQVNTAPYYSIPPDNPFIKDPDVIDEVWATGLRNAWRWSFDKSTGDMWIGDVGQDSMEEIDYRTPAQGLAGSNFGWQCYEGTNTYKLNGCGSKSNYVFPIFEYHHDISAGGECLIGGYVYRGSDYPALKGYYLCCDFISQNLWKIKPDGTGGWNIYLQRNAAPKAITSFGEGDDGELYAVSNKYGTFYKITATASATASNNSDQMINVKDENVRSLVYPTIIDNSTVYIDLKESFNAVRVLSMSGNEIMKKDISGQSGKISLQLPRLNAGMYIVQLLGNKMLQQKIYVSK
jgi:glucose/arabinose dehydrogenase